MKNRIRNYLLKHLLKTVVEKDILTVDKFGAFYLQGKKLEDKEIEFLRQEAQEMQKMWLWSIITNTPKHQAQKSMFEKSLKYDDMISGKMILYTVDVQENIVKKLSTYKKS